MQQNNPTTPRKKFLWWGAAALGSFSILKFSFRRKKEKKEMVKMLTQDGRLVEIDRSLLAAGSKKITNEELQQWVNKKSSQSKNQF